VLSDPFKHQEISGTSFSPVVDGSNTVALTYNAGESFVEIGKCAYCDECELYTSIQFDGPINDARLRKLVWTVPYVQANTVPGPQTYHYGTDLYCWIRGATLSRRLGDATESRQLAAGNVFSLVDDADLVDVSNGINETVTSLAPVGGINETVTSRAPVGMASPLALFVLSVFIPLLRG